MIVRAMPIQSKELQLSGICDVVEFIQDPDGVELAGVKGTYKVYPVEYKRGSRKRRRRRHSASSPSDVPGRDDAVPCGHRVHILQRDQASHRSSD